MTFPRGTCGVVEGSRTGIQKNTDLGGHPLGMMDVCCPLFHGRLQAPFPCC